MTDREKLVKLIVEIENEIIKAYPYTTDQFRIETIVDYLLANGVMVYDWISVKDKLPEDRQEVIGWEGDYAEILYYDAEFNEWNDANGWRQELDKFSYWIPLPKPPKEKRRCHV